MFHDAVLIQAAVAALADREAHVELGTVCGLGARFDDPTRQAVAHVVILEDGDEHRALLDNGALLVELAEILASDLGDPGMGGQVQTIAAAFKAYAILDKAIAPFRAHLETIAKVNRDITNPPMQVAS